MSRDNPLVDGKTQYSVRLLFNVEANNPLHAAGRFIDQVNTFGQKTWVYRVQDIETGEEFMVHPEDDKIYTLEEFETRMAGETQDVTDAEQRV